MGLTSNCPPLVVEAMETAAIPQSDMRERWKPELSGRVGGHPH